MRFGRYVTMFGISITRITKSAIKKRYGIDPLKIMLTLNLKDFSSAASTSK
jgi:hypothetical protein